MKFFVILFLILFTENSFASESALNIGLSSEITSEHSSNGPAYNKYRKDLHTELSAEYTLEKNSADFNLTIFELVN